MEKQRKPRKQREWDPIRKLTGQYQNKIKAVHKEIDENALTGRGGKVATPNYVNEVIIPLDKMLSEKHPALNISINCKVERVNPKEAYFKMQIGEYILGGLSYPGPGASHINFTVFAHEKPWGKTFQITKLAQLIEVIHRLMDFLDLDKNLDKNGNE